MSNGLGISYVKNEIVDYLKTNGTKVLTVQGGYKKKLPRYYEEKMFSDPTEKMLWKAAAVAEIEKPDDQLTDKQRSELIKLHEYRNERDKLKGSI